MADYAIRTEHRERTTPEFHEQLYEALKATPWWLASTAAHALGFLLLGALTAGGIAPAPVERILDIGSADPLLDQDPEIPPEVLVTPAIDEPENPPVSEEPEVRSDDTVETQAAEPLDSRETPGDPRFKVEGPFEGNGRNVDMGVGGDAGGGLTGRRARRKNLREVGDGNVVGAADAALDWLRRHQSASGAWDGDDFESLCVKNKCGGAGGPLYDPGLTGLSLLAFLGTGETHRSPQYGSVIRGGLKYLKGIQDAEGCFGSRTSNHFTYNHAIATIAMAEAYGLTQSPLFRTSAQNGIRFVKDCQNPYLAWRYGVRPQDNDTSVTGWMVMALKSGVSAGLEVDPDCFDGARAWIDKATEPEYGRTGYTARNNGPSRPQELLDRFPADKSESLTAVAVLVRIFAGAKQEDDMVRKGTELCLRSTPSWDEAAGTVDFYYWYYGTLALWQVGGKAWEKWEAGMKSSLVAHQRLDPKDCRHGSWDPVDPWSPDGGRVYATAINALSLEVYYRSSKVSWVK